MSYSQERISIANSILKALSSGCVYFCLPNIINPMYIQQLREMVPPPNQNNVGVNNQTTLPILYCISSKLVTLLKSP